MATHWIRSLFLSLMILLGFSGSVWSENAYTAIHGVDAQAYQTWVARTVADGFRLINVNGTDNGGSPAFSAVAVKDGKQLGWEAHHDQTLQDYQKNADNLATKGFRPISLSGYSSAGSPRVADVWVQDRGKILWEAHPHLTAQGFQDAVDRLSKKRLRPDMVTGYMDGTGSHRFAALFIEAGKTGWLARHDMTAEQYQKLIDEVSPRQFRPTSVTAYPTPAGLRFAAVFVKNAQGWVAKHDLSSAEYQAEFDRNSKKGYRPVSIAGYTIGPPPNPEAYDEAMRKYMRERGIGAGTLAVSQNGKLLLSRGYGFADAARERRVQADDPFRIASVSKPITAAAVHALIREGKLSLDTKVFPLLGLKPPPGQKPDPRLNAVTIRHLLEHKGGWDQENTYDPMFRPLEISAALGKPGPASAGDVVVFMMGQPLQFDPGSRDSYSNFGYCVLGRVIEKVTGETYMAHVQRKVLAPLGIRTIEVGHSLTKNRNPREPSYLDPGRGRNVVEPQSKEVASPDGTFYLEAMDSHGGLIASSRDLLRFLDAYWISGEPRTGNGASYTFFGSLPGTYSMAMQVPNGVNVAAIFNQRTDPSKLEYAKIKDVMQDASNSQKGGEVRYAAVWLKNE
jgi:CubicO group peptidase (beta-lactamase class C family)